MGLIFIAQQDWGLYEMTWATAVVEKWEFYVFSTKFMFLCAIIVSIKKYKSDKNDKKETYFGVVLVDCSWWLDWR